MKLRFSQKLAVIAIGLLASLSLAGQTSLKTTPAGPDRHGDPSQEAKEKAEDAELLQKLEAGQPPDAEPKFKDQFNKDQFNVRGSSRGGGAKAGAGPVGVPFTAQNVFTRSGGGSIKPLLVRTSDPEPKAQASLEEDLSVMAHILSKAADEFAGGRANMKALGIDVFFTPGSSPLRGLYLDNYGAVFFLTVGFPLVAPPEKNSEEKATADSDWEDARQELYGQRQGGVMGEPAEDYSQEKVDKLKEKLLETLKNATNIRELKPEDSVTVWVAGGPNGGGRAKVRKGKAGPTNPSAGNFIALEQPSPQSRRTFLTIRARKADIDAYAKGKVTLEEFQKHARITTYTGDAPGGGAESWAVGGYTARTRQ